MAIADITSELASWSPPEDVTSWTRSSTSEIYSFNVFIIIFSVRALRIIMMGI